MQMDQMESLSKFSVTTSIIIERMGSFCAKERESIFLYWNSFMFIPGVDFLFIDLYRKIDFFLPFDIHQYIHIHIHTHIDIYRGVGWDLYQILYRFIPRSRFFSSAWFFVHRFIPRSRFFSSAWYTHIHRHTLI